MRRVILAVLMPAGLIALALITFFVVLFGRAERRLEVARGMSRTLCGLFDGTGDVTYSAWSYWMVLRGKEFGPKRVEFVDWINQSPGHCQRAYEWHEQHRLFDNTPKEI